MNLVTRPAGHSNVLMSTHGVSYSGCSGLRASMAFCSAARLSSCIDASSCSIHRSAATLRKQSSTAWLMASLWRFSACPLTWQNSWRAQSFVFEGLGGLLYHCWDPRYFRHCRQSLARLNSLSRTLFFQPCPAFRDDCTHGQLQVVTALYPPPPLDALFIIKCCKSAGDVTNKVHLRILHRKQKDPEQKPAR